MFLVPSDTARKIGASFIFGNSLYFNVYCIALQSLKIAAFEQRLLRGAPAGVQLLSKGKRLQLLGLLLL